MSDNYVPGSLGLEVAEANLKAKLDAIENERVQNGAELDAYEALSKTDESFASEREAFRRAVKAADARIVATQAALNRIRAATSENSKPSK